MPEITVAQALSLGIQHHQAGRIAEAEAVYRQILAVHPQHPDALHLLGVIAGGAGRLDLAEEFIRRAIAVSPGEFIYHSNLGRMFREHGRLSAALELHQQARQLRPDSADTWLDLGLTYDALRQIASAVEAYQQAARLASDNPTIFNNLGNALRSLGRISEAEQAFQRALALKPDMVEAHGNYGVLLESLGRYAEAIPHYRQALVGAPQHPTLHFNMGIALAELGQLDDALAYYRQAIRYKPDYFEAHNNLGNVLKSMGRYDEALAAYRQAIALHPELAEAHANLASILDARGEHEESMAHHRRAVALQPGSAVAHGNMCYNMLFLPQFDVAAIRDELRLWNERHGAPLRNKRLPHANNRDPERRLRVGYVSPDFRDHVIARNMLPVFQNRDRDHFEVYSYSNLTLTDSWTPRFRDLSDHWRDIRAVPPDQVAARIREDGIDILVDLALHMAGSSLLAFAHKPAPVQVTFAGYPGSTGLETMDYRLSDPHLDPPENDALYSEKTLRLPHSFWCYDPHGEIVAPNELPAITAGCVTFGCLNNFGKLNDDVLDLWSRVLIAVERSRLILLSPEGTHRRHAVEFLQARGITADRVEFTAVRPRPEYLRHYHRIDLGLDSLPYNGHTTSLDSMWMGVPVVTLVGRTVVGRAGYSQLMNLGMPELVTWDRDAFVRTAVDLARDLPRLAGIRSTLRPRMEQSPLMDAAGFTRGIEAAYRQMWRAWCAQSNGRNP